MTPLTPLQLAELYFDCFQAKDFEPLRPYLHPAVTFDGVMGVTRGTEDFLTGVTATAQGAEKAVLRKRLADETDSMTWFTMTTEGADLEVVNWAQVTDGLITAVRVTFDPRPLFG